MHAILVVKKETDLWGRQSLAFLPIAIGTLLSIFPMLYLKKRYERILIQRNGLPPPPEERLIPLLIAGPCLIISLFWLGWTHFREISPFVPIISGLFAGEFCLRPQLSSAHLANSQASHWCSFSLGSIVGTLRVASVMS